MLQSLGEYASRITSLASLGMLTTIGGAYRAYLGSLPEGKLAEWIAQRNGQMDVYRTRGSLIFTIPMVLQASVITVYGAVAIAIGATAAPSLEAWRVAVLLLLGLVMVCGSWMLIYWTHKPSTFMDRWQLAYETRTWRSGDSELVRQHINRTGFILIAIGTFMQVLDNAIGQGTLSLWKLLE